MSKRFQNLDPEHRRPVLADVWKWAVWHRLIGKRKVQPPGPPAPSVEHDRSLTDNNDSRLALTWVGHSSVLAQFERRSLLIDPVFSERIGVFYQRHGIVGVDPKDLPHITATLITHNHYDHLDKPSRHTPIFETSCVVAPRGLGRAIRRWLQAGTIVYELDWWECVSIEGLRITFVPARHWSSRGPFDANKSLWGGFVIESHDAKLYHAGDSAWFDGFAEIGQRFPNLDVGMIPAGGYVPEWFMLRNHMTPEEAGRAFVDCGARTMVPIHWGTFQMTDEPLCEPPERLERWWRDQPQTELSNRQLKVMSTGETFKLD